VQTTLRALPLIFPTEYQELLHLLYHFFYKWTSPNRLGISRRFLYWILRVELSNHVKITGCELITHASPLEGIILHAKTEL